MSRVTEAEKRAHRDSQRERYHWLKSRRFCTSCGLEKAAAGHVNCQRCIDKRKAARDAKRAAGGKG